MMKLLGQIIALSVITSSPFVATSFTSPFGQRRVNNKCSTNPTHLFMGNQAEYGGTLPFPETYVRCGQCDSYFALQEDDLGQGRGRRVTCSVCDHSWFQSKDKLFTLKSGFEFAPMDEIALERISSNLKAGRKAKFMGASKLYVGNLDFTCKESDLQEFFSAVGEVGDVSVVRSPDGRSRGFAFVTMISKEGGEKGLELDGTELLGREVQVRTPNS